MASWLRHIEHAAAAVRVLHDLGFGIHAAPIRRLIVEHATRLAAMATQPETFASEVRAFQYQTGRLQKELSDIGIEPWEGMQETMSLETDQSTKNLDGKVSMKERLAMLGEMGRRFRATWSHESALSHANYATAVIYLAETPGDEWPTLTPSPQVPAGGWIADMSLADALIMSLDAFSSVVEGDPYRAEVERLNHKKDSLMDEAKRVGVNKDLDPPLREDWPLWGMDG